MNNMNKYLNYLVACLLSLAALSSCSDDNEPTPVPVPDPTPSGYCLMFYMSGGDPEHDILLMESARQAAEATGDDVAVTILMKASGKGEGEAHNGTCRYTAQDGVLTQDTEFGTVDDFAVTDPTNLAEFIRWSAEQYPCRRYLLAFGGHGITFSPETDLPDPADDTRADRPGTRASLSDNGNLMTAAQLGNAIRQSGVDLEALIAHSCQQGSIEMLAEWEGTADYLLGSPFSIPDYAYDYNSLINDLREGCSVEETLKRTAHRAINLWQEFHNQGVSGMVMEVTRLRDLSPLWDVLRQTLDLMHESMDEVNLTTDAPAVYGETYGKGYMRALVDKYERDHSDFFQNTRAFYAVDLPGYLHAAFVHSGNMSLASYINRLDKVLADIVVTHRQTDGKYDFLYNVYTNLSNYSSSEEARERYHDCRFDQLTGWGTFYEDLMDYVNQLPDEPGRILTPIADHLTGKWKVTKLFYKEYGEWVPEKLPVGSAQTFTLRANGELFRTRTSAYWTDLYLSDWGDTDDTDFTFRMDKSLCKIHRLTKNKLELTEEGFPQYKMRLRRVSDEDEKTLAERMVGKWILSKRYQKVDGAWVEVTDDLPLECWSEYTEAGKFTTYTRWADEEHLNEDMTWRVHELTGVITYWPSEEASLAYFRIALEDDDTLVMNYAENYNPTQEEQVNTEYKDILVRN